MKDYIIEIEMKDAEKIAGMAMELGYHLENFEGSLQDNFIIYHNEQIRVGRSKPRKYIIVTEVPLNEWSSTLKMIMTDSENIMKEYQTKFEINSEELEYC